MLGHWVPSCKAPALGGPRRMAQPAAGLPLPTALRPNHPKYSKITCTNGDHPVVSILYLFLYLCIYCILVELVHYLHPRGLLYILKLKNSKLVRTEMNDVFRTTTHKRKRARTEPRAKSP